MHVHHIHSHDTHRLITNYIIRRYPLSIPLSEVRLNHITLQMFDHFISTAIAISYGYKYQVQSKNFLSACPRLPGNNRIITNQNFGIFILILPFISYVTLRKSFSNLGTWFPDLYNKHGRGLILHCNFMTVLNRHVVQCIQNAELVRTFFNFSIKVFLVVPSVSILPSFPLKRSRQTLMIIT